MFGRLTSLASLSVILSCASSENGGVEISIDGPHQVGVGQTILLTAETLRGTDHAHSWESEDPMIASVEDGRVTGVAVGETEVIATGEDTGRSGRHVIVVTEDGVAGTTTSDPTTGGSDTDDPSGGGTTTGSNPGDGVPFYDQWLMSGHADANSEAFNHWNEDGEIPTSCARCHSLEGFRDYLGDDGSEVGIVNQPAPLGSVVGCETCHNEAANALDWAEFDSGVRVTDLGGEARCMTCHQGRGSTDSVEQVIVDAGVGDDEVSEDLGFENIHYYPAAATLFAGQVRGGYQYEDQVYDRRFRHVPDQNDCIGCHNPHTAKVRWDDCTQCHSEAVDGAGARDIRMIASFNVDYDGDGDTSVGVYYEVKGLEEKLYRAIQRYASSVLGQTICYESSSYPYWFNSTNGANAECTAEEADYGNRYATWSPRLLRATYNYQMARKDPGAFAHNSRYIIKLLHDSIQDLNSALSNPVDMSAAARNAVGHFNGAGRAARYWDEDEEVSSSCSKCHSGAQGFRFFIEYQVGMTVPETSNGLECYTCHENFGTTYDVLAVESTIYPSGIELEHDGYDNICATCHSGRRSKATIDDAIDSGNLSLRNAHYKPAAAVRNGTESQGGYEYDNRVYSGMLQHDSRTQCAGCHEPAQSNHTFRISDVWEQTCRTCHNDQTEAREVRLVHLADYNGNADTDEGLDDELAGLADLLLQEIVIAAPSPICYDADARRWRVPITPTAICTDYSGSFENWTPELMRAAFNYDLHALDAGAYAHNFEYMGQLLYDSIEDLGGNVTGLIRP